MPTIKSFDITLSDINFLLDQMRNAIIIVDYVWTGDPDYPAHAGEPVYGFADRQEHAHAWIVRQLRSPQHHRSSHPIVYL